MTVNNDYLKGYINALNNIIEFLNISIEETNDYASDMNDGYFNTKLYIQEVKKNYKNKRNEKILLFFLCLYFLPFSLPT